MMNKEERFVISVNQEDVQNIIDCYEKDIEYIKELEQRIDKAIEYATKEMRIVNDNEYHKLLEILGGKE